MKSVKKKKILILGVNGFIGNSLARRIVLSNNAKVIGFDKNNNNIKDLINNKNFDFYKGDIFKEDKWILNSIKKCDIIIPLVAIATPKIYVKDPIKIFELDFESNLKIIRWVAKYNKRLIFPSTSEVYGMTKDKIFNEYSTNLTVGPVIKSRWIYSISKQLLDRLIIAYGEKNNLKYTIFRPFNWIGPRLDSLKQAQLGNGRVISIYIHNILNNKNLVIVGKGDQKRSFTFLDDGVSALIKIIIDKNNNLNKKIFNIGNPKNNISIKELASILVKKYNKFYPNKYNRKIIYKSQKEFYGEGYEDIPTRVPDIGEAKKYLNWEPKVNLSNSITMTLQSFIYEK
tara:strand:- start:2690 stop:3715 length:1026 start_codon:yes stop_codon:yes gene_type:complete